MRRGVLPTIRPLNINPLHGSEKPRHDRKKIAISEVSCEDHFGDFLRLARRNPLRICSGGWNNQCSVLQRCNGKAPKQNSTCWTGHVWIWWLVPFARQRPIPQCDNRQAVFGPTKSDYARPPSVFARFNTCWLLFVPKSEIPLEGASLWLDFGHPESRDKYILKTIAKDDFYKGIQKLYDRANPC